MSRFGNVTGVPTVTTVTSGMNFLSFCEISIPAIGLIGRCKPIGSSVTTAPGSGRPALSVTVAVTPAAWAEWANASPASGASRIFRAGWAWRRCERRQDEGSTANPSSLVSVARRAMCN